MSNAQIITDKGNYKKTGEVIEESVILFKHIYSDNCNSVFYHEYSLRTLYHISYDDFMSIFLSEIHKFRKGNIDVRDVKFPKPDDLTASFWY